MVIRQALDRAALVREKPAVVMELLGLVFGDEWAFPEQAFRDLLNSIVQQDPSLEETPNFRRISAFLAQRG